MKKVTLPALWRRIDALSVELSLELQSLRSSIGYIVGEINSFKSGQAMLSERLESLRTGGSQDTIATLTKHCERLLREKETLVRLLGEQKLAEANRFMATPTLKYPATMTAGNMSAKFCLKCDRMNSPDVEKCAGCGASMMPPRCGFCGSHHDPDVWCDARIHNAKWMETP